MLGSVTTLVRLAAFVFALILVHRAPTSAAEISCLREFPPPSNACAEALIRGKIVKGDYERFRAFYEEHVRAVDRLFLVSPGGDADEAMKIGRVLRKYLLAAKAPVLDPGTNRVLLQVSKGKVKETLCQGPSCTCASACALIWFGAVSRMEIVGLHRPRITDPHYAALPPAEASVVYRRALQDISRYLDEMEVPRPVIDDMMATSSSEIRWVNAFDNDELLMHPPSFVEWVDASCGAFTSQEKEMVAKLRPHSDRLTQRQSDLLKGLWEKWDRRIACETKLVVRARRKERGAPY